MILVEYAPYIRDEVDENYAGIQELFEGCSVLAAQPALAARTFMLCKGRHSYHRVTPIFGTTQLGVNILYSYDKRLGMVFSEASQREKTQPTSGANVGMIVPDRKHKYS